MKQAALTMVFIISLYWVFGQQLSIQTNEQVFGQADNSSILKIGITNCLKDIAISTSDTIMIAIDANTSRGNTLRGLYFALLSANVDITISDNNMDVSNYQKSFIDLKGGGTNYDQASNKAYQKGLEEICAYVKVIISDNYSGKPNEMPAPNLLSYSHSSEVDIDIPENNRTYKDAYALIIGNEDYTKYQSGLNSESNVQFAIADATTFSLYAEKTLGVPKENIVLLTDAVSTQIKRELTKLTKLIEYSEGKARVYFYYAGHGYPDPETKEPYLIPVDVTGSDVRNGIQLYDLYRMLTEFPLQDLTVFIDACFSGGGRNQGLIAARSVKVKPKQDLIEGNIIVFSASSGDQVSNPYPDKGHGLFTYFLLKKLQETKGDVSYEQLADFIRKNVKITAIKMLNREQTPEVNTGSIINSSWKNKKLIE